MTAAEASPELRSVTATAREGRYSEAAERCLQNLQASDDVGLRTRLILELARLAYVLRPTRGDALPVQFVSLQTLLNDAQADTRNDHRFHARVVAAQAHLASWREPASGLAGARQAVMLAEATGDAVC